MAQYNYNGKMYNFPDDVSEDEALAFIDADHPEEQAQGAAQAAPQQPTQDEPTLLEKATPTLINLLQYANPENIAKTTQGYIEHPKESVEQGLRAAAGAAAGLGNIPVGLWNKAKEGGAYLDKVLGLGDGTYTQTAPIESMYPESWKPKNEREALPGQIMPWMMPVGEAFKVAEGAGLLAKAGAVGVRGVQSALPGTLSQDPTADASQFTLDLLKNAAMGAGAEVGLNVLAKGIGKVRNVIPEWMGGRSTAEQAADTVKPSHLEDVTQGGNAEQQQAYRTATSDETGASNITPSNAFNPNSPLGKSAIEQEQAARAAINDGKPAHQVSEEAITQAMNDMPQGVSLDEATKAITDHFKQTGGELYKSAKGNAQSVLDSKRVTELHLRNTKQAAQDAINAHSTKGVRLTGETRTLLKDFQNAKVTDIDVLDNWKRTINEARSNAWRNGRTNDLQVLNDLSKSLKSEADAVITRIDPNAGELYRNADKYHSQWQGDFGKKSPFDKFLKQENPVSANEFFLGNTGAKGAAKGRINTENAVKGIQDAVARGDLPQALADQWLESLGATTREQAFLKSKTGDVFNPNTFNKNLATYRPMALAAGQEGLNQALIDANNSVLNASKVGATGVSKFARAVGTVGGSVAGGFVGHAVGGPLGMGVGGTMGATAYNATANAISEGVSGLMNKIGRVTSRTENILNYVREPAQAQEVLDIIAKRGATPETVSRNELIGIVQGLMNNSPDTSNLEASAAPTKAVTPQGNTSTQATPSASPEAAQEPEQHAQVARMGAKYDKAIGLYQAIASAETGGIADPYIRTRAPEGAEPSTAYGTVQLTAGHLRDFVKRHPDVFTKSENEYVNRFLEQGKRFHDAPKDDPKYGYGAPGDLTSDADKKLYQRVVIKMIDKEIKDYGGSMDQTLIRWRGNNKDTGYFQKVVKSYKANKSKQGWGSGSDLSNIFTED
ncbi:hypothetical protein E2L92_22020 [Salmonella enterica subsp. enterica serovar Ibadan]|nr:hypothetical protein [Salmonella enterica subsp. enterica serovar Ibadan]ECF3282130.1 hypothetical protein [Salmonella enterica subsp. enterica serovar Ibadan]